MSRRAIVTLAAVAGIVLFGDAAGIVLVTSMPLGEEVRARGMTYLSLAYAARGVGSFLGVLLAGGLGVWLGPRRTAALVTLVGLAGSLLAALGAPLLLTAPIASLGAGGLDVCALAIAAEVIRRETTSAPTSRFAGTAVAALGLAAIVGVTGVAGPGLTALLSADTGLRFSRCAIFAAAASTLAAALAVALVVFPRASKATKPQDPLHPFREVSLPVEIAPEIVPPAGWKGLFLLLVLLLPYSAQYLPSFLPSSGLDARSQGLLMALAGGVALLGRVVLGLVLLAGPTRKLSLPRLVAVGLAVHAAGLLLAIPTGSVPFAAVGVGVATLGGVPIGAIGSAYAVLATREKTAPWALAVWRTLGGAAVPFFSVLHAVLGEMSGAIELVVHALASLGAAAALFALAPRVEAMFDTQAERPVVPVS